MELLTIWSIQTQHYSHLVKQFNCTKGPASEIMSSALNFYGWKIELSMAKLLAFFLEQSGPYFNVLLHLQSSVGVIANGFILINTKYAPNHRNHWLIINWYICISSPVTMALWSVGSNKDANSLYLKPNADLKPPKNVNSPSKTYLV